MNTRWYILPILLLLTGGISFGQPGGAIQPPDDKAPQGLDWMITPEGKVRLFWNEPNSGLSDLDRYEVLRSPLGYGQFTLIANTNLEQKYTDLTVKPGDRYDYLVRAHYKNDPDPHGAFTTVIYPDDKPIFEIVSYPPPTVKTGTGYEYVIELHADQLISTIKVHLEGAPENMEAYDNIGGMPRIRWQNTETGVYDFALIATGIDHLNRTVKAIQNIRLVVAPKTGFIDGSVTTIKDDAIPFSHVQLFLFQEDGKDTKITITTDEFGYFSADNVPVGEIIAYCFPGDDSYAPRYYSVGGAPATKLIDAELLSLKEDRTLSIDFKLPEIGDDRITFSGSVLSDNTSDPLPYASIHFIRKNNFILIGDKDIKDNPTLIENWSSTKIDTTIVSNKDGEFSTQLTTGIDYYVVVEKEGYFESFNPDIYYNYTTNALEARPIRTIKHNHRHFTYRMVENSGDVHSVQGVIRRGDNNLNEPATVLLIQKEMKAKRGTGGGSTYTYGQIRSVLTDSSGVYEFKNVPSNQYMLLAIPLNRDVVPQYYNGSPGGAITFDNSGLVAVTNTIQGIDFELQPAKNDGLGILWGRVSLKVNDEPRKFISGAVVCAIDPAEQRIVGYAISDTLGWYTIPNLRPGTYDIIADHPQHGWDSESNIDLRYISLGSGNRVHEENLEIEIQTTGIDYNPADVPTAVVLYHNYPNPFNPSTTIRFGIHKRMNVKLSVFNAYGQQVEVLEEGELTPGSYSVKFDASDLSSGMYYYRLTAGSQTITKSMMLVK